MPYRYWHSWPEEKPERDSYYKLTIEDSSNIRTIEIARWDSEKEEWCFLKQMIDSCEVLAWHEIQMPKPYYRRPVWMYDANWNLIGEGEIIV